MDAKYCFVCTHPGGHGSDPSFSVKIATFNNDGTVAGFRPVNLDDAYPGRLIQEIELMLRDLKAANTVHKPEEAVGYRYTDTIPF
jgi:hypothetical protein